MSDPNDRARLQREITDISVELARLPLTATHRDKRLALNALKVQREADLDALLRTERASVVKTRLEAVEQGLRDWSADTQRRAALKKERRELESELAELTASR